MQQIMLQCSTAMGLIRHKGGLPGTGSDGRPKKWRARLAGQKRRYSHLHDFCSYPTRPHASVVYYMLESIHRLDVGKGYSTAMAATVVLHVTTGLNVGGAEIMLMRFLAHQDRRQFNCTRQTVRRRAAAGALKWR
jgi:hypothetical protein